MHRRIDAVVLRQFADDAALAVPVLVDQHQVGFADAVSDRAEMRIGADAGGEALATMLIDRHFAEKLDFDAEDIVDALGPGLVVGLHGIDERDDAVPADANGNQATDRPAFGQVRGSAFDDGGDGSARAAAGHDMAKQPVAGSVRISAFCGVYRRTFIHHHSNFRFPRKFRRSVLMGGFLISADFFAFWGVDDLGL